MYKFSLLFGSFIFIVYLGILPLLGFKVWSKYNGWIEISNFKALGSIVLGLLLFLIYKNILKNKS